MFAIHICKSITVCILWPTKLLHYSCSQNISAVQVLAISRIMVAWQPVGIAAGVYDMCVRYTNERKQFSKPLAAFQLQQERLARMAGSIQVPTTPPPPYKHSSRSNTFILLFLFVYSIKESH